MVFHRPLLGLLACLVTTLASPMFAASAPPRGKPTRPTEPSAVTDGYKGAITVDASTGKVLFEDNADIVNPPASMTKLMTFAVLHDKLAAGTLTLDTPITVNADDSRIGGTQVWLKEKEVFPVEELIFAMMVQSANDAAYSLARNSAGSVEAFVAEMNAKAHELGMNHTTFRSPHGLPPSSRKLADSDVSTPRDFALLCRYLLQKTDVLKYTSVDKRAFGEGKRDEPVMMENHDNLLGKVKGVDGLKTGYTLAAGFCLSATAQRNSHRIIVVSMGGKTSKSRDIKVIEFLEKGLASVPADSPPFSGPETKTMAVGGTAAATGTASSLMTAAPLSSEEKKAAAAQAESSAIIKFTPPVTKKK